MACGQAGCERWFWSGKDSLNRAVCYITHPAMQLVQMRDIHKPVAIANTLHAPVDDEAARSH